MEVTGDFESPLSEWLRHSWEVRKWRERAQIILLRSVAIQGEDRNFNMG